MATLSVPRIGSSEVMDEAPCDRCAQLSGCLLVVQEENRRLKEAVLRLRQSAALAVELEQEMAALEARLACEQEVSHGLRTAVASSEARVEALQRLVDAGHREPSTAPLDESNPSTPRSRLSPPRTSPWALRLEREANRVVMRRYFAFWRFKR